VRWHAPAGRCYGSRMTAPWRRAALLVLLCAGCARSGGSVELLAPFSDDSVVGQLTASWHETGNVRAESAGEPGAREVAFRVDALNRLSDPLYLRLGDFRLTAADGTSAASAATIACALAPGATPAVLSGTLWMPAVEGAAIRGFRLDHFALPLSRLGRAFYREFLLQQGREAAAIDAEMAAYGAAPGCHSAQ